MKEIIYAIILAFFMGVILWVAYTIFYNWYWNPIVWAKRKLKNDKKVYKKLEIALLDIAQSYFVAYVNQNHEIMYAHTLCFKVLNGARKELEQEIKETIKYLENVDTN